MSQEKFLVGDSSTVVAFLMETPLTEPYFYATANSIRMKRDIEMHVKYFSDKCVLQAEKIVIY